MRRGGVRRVAGLALLAALTACGPKAPARAPRPAALPAQVVYDFETTTLASQAAWVELFDFATVGGFEILLRRYDLLGRLTDLTDEERADLERDDGTPYPAERERRNVSRFYQLLAQRTVGTGGCTAGPPRWKYNQRLGLAFEPLPPGHEAYEPLRVQINAELARGGVVAIRCAGGRGSLALVYSQRDTPRGYDIITIYDDGAR